MAKDPITHLTQHALLGEQLVALVRESGVLKRPRRAKAARRRSHKKKEAAKKAAAPRRAIPAETKPE